MTRLTEVEAHIASISELLDIVGAMRALASMRIQEAHRAVPGVRRYTQSMASGIGEVLRLTPERASSPRASRGARLLIVCMAEHGFVGGFNERLLGTVGSDAGERDVLFIVGSRGAMLASERGRPAAWVSPMATRLAGVSETVRRLSLRLYQTIAQNVVNRAEVVFARYRQGSMATIERRLLFPLDPASFTTKTTRLPPLHNLAPAVLLEKLIAEYVSALLTEAAIESLASENAARFTAMDSAHDNVSKKLDRLQEEARQARQSEITTELIDLVTGAEALNKGAGQPP
jgi:F-type H+-transporting ATPase subunit gamma